jgi:DoxX-like protein
MTTANLQPLTAGKSAAIPRWRTIVYWVVTVYVAGTAVIAGAMDLLRVEPVFGDLLHLGYPAYFGAILGTWKVLGALVLVVPRYPRVKEWAYAGMFIDFSAAVVSYVAVGDVVVSKLIGPIMAIACLGASWALRPSSRRLAGS